MLSGWVGLGYYPDPNTMTGADITLARFFPNGSWEIVDCYAIDVGTPTPDVLLGGTDDLRDKKAVALSELQIFYFARKLVTPAKCDHNFLDESFVMIYAFSPSEELVYHGPNRFFTHMNWFVSPEEIQFVSSSLRTAIQILVALMMLVALIFLALVVRNRLHARIVYASFLFCSLICIGVLFGYLSVLVSTFDPNAFVCFLQFAFLSIGFIFVYGCILAKTWRIHRIFNGSLTPTDESVTNSMLLFYLTLVASVEVVIFMIWYTADPMDVFYHSPRPNMLVPSCQSATDGGLAAFLAVKMAMLLFGVYLSVVVRNVDTRYNESVSLSVSLYVTFATSVLCVPLGFVMRVYVNGALIVFAVGGIFVFTFTLVAQFVPKFLRIYSFDPQVQKSPSMSDLGRRARSLPAVSI